MRFNNAECETMQLFWQEYSYSISQYTFKIQAIYSALKQSHCWFACHPVSFVVIMLILCQSMIRSNKCWQNQTRLACDLVYHPYTYVVMFLYAPFFTFLHLHFPFILALIAFDKYTGTLLIQMSADLRPLRNLNAFFIMFIL